MRGIAVMLALVAALCAAAAGTEAETPRFATYGEAQAYLEARGATNDHPRAEALFLAQKRLEFSDGYKAAVAADFARLTNLSVLARPSLVYRGYETLVRWFGPKKFFSQPADQLARALEGPRLRRTDRPPLWLRALRRVEVLELPDGRNCHIVRGCGKGEAHSEKALLLCHGGGMILSSSAGHWDLARFLSGETGQDIWLPDYPLLPDTDMYRSTTTCFEAYRRMLETYGAENVTILGDSAGSGLALTVTCRARKAGLPLARRLILFSPAHIDTGEEHCLEEMRLLEPGDVMLPLRLVEDLCVLLSPGAEADLDECDPYHCDLAGFPPMTIFTGSREYFSAHAIRFYEYARERGCQAELFAGAGMMHDWLVLPFAPESAAARALIAERMSR